MVSIIKCKGCYFNHGLNNSLGLIVTNIPYRASKFHPKRMARTTRGDLSSLDCPYCYKSCSKILARPPNDEEMSPLHLPIINIGDTQSP